MKHITFTEKSLLVDDEAADLLLQYARRLGETGGVDTVTLRAISPDGNTVDASILLNSSTVMLVESTNSAVEPPDNTSAIRYLKDRLDNLDNPPNAQTEQIRDRQDSFEDDQE